jgi:hypothetical protein
VSVYRLLDAADGDAAPQAARTAALLYTGACVSELLSADTETSALTSGTRVLHVRR